MVNHVNVKTPIPDIIITNHSFYRSMAHNLVPPPPPVLDIETFYTLENAYSIEPFSLRTRIRAVKMLSDNIASNINATREPPVTAVAASSMTPLQILDCARTIEESI